MKKILSLFAMLCLAQITVKADTDVTAYDNIIYVASATVDPADGTEIELSICMNNTADIRGFQFDMYLPDGMTAVKTSKGKIVASLNAARLSKDDEHTLTVAEQADGALRFLCGSQYDETFTGTSGKIATIKVNIKGLSNGKYPITLKAVKLSETDISKFYEVSEVVTKLTVSSATEDTDVTDYNNIIYVAPAIVDPVDGTEIELSICMNNTADIRGFQFDMYLPDGMTAVKTSKGKVAASLNAARLPEDDEHTLTVAEQADDAIRFLCGSQYDETFTGTSGEIATVKVNIKNMADGEYPIILKDIKLSETDISKFYEVDDDVTTLTISTGSTQAAADQAAADAVIAKIADIGEVAYTDECKALIDAARKAYDALTDTQKELVTNDEVLTDAEATYAALKAAADQAAAEQAANQAAANAVIAKIADIGEVAYTDESKALIDAAREAYDELTDTQKELVTNDEVLTDAEATYADLKAAADQAAAEQAANQAAANAVIAKIADIGEVAYTDESKAFIDAAREAYDALTDTQKELVTNYNVLTDAEATYADLKAAADQAAAEQAAAEQAAAEQAAANQAAADAVIAKIADIGEVAYTDECKALIDAAREAYDELTDTQKELVTNYNVLTDAEATYAELKATADQAAAEQAANQAAANAVIAKIADIGEVAYTDESKALIDAAREAYDALTDAQKELVTNDEVLTDAEATYAELKAAADQAAAEQAAAEQAAAEQAAANQAAADAVIAKIADIGEVTYTDESKALIDASRAAYDALTDTQKELVTNYNVLTDAEATYADLKTAADQAAAEQAANQAAANAVIAKIADIGEVAYTDECKALIDAAREAYDALTETQKELVANYNVLTDAEKTYADLEAYTGINDTPVNDAIKEKGWYDMNGHRLAGKPTVKGMYVKDGKKVIITF